MCTNFHTKWTALNIWEQIGSKMDFAIGISKIQLWIRNQHLHYIMCANFQSKWIFDLDLEKLPIYVQYFGSNISESVAESWLDVDGGGCTV